MTAKSIRFYARALSNSHAPSNARTTSSIFDSSYFTDGRGDDFITSFAAIHHVSSVGLLGVNVLDQSVNA